MLFYLYSNTQKCIPHCECILSHWLVRKQLNHIVRSIPSHVGTRKHQVDSWPSLLFCIHENIQLHVSISDIQFPQGHRVHNPPYSLFIGHFIAPLWFSFTLFHFQFLMFSPNMVKSSPGTMCSRCGLGTDDRTLSL